MSRVGRWPQGSSAQHLALHSTVPRSPTMCLRVFQTLLVSLLQAGWGCSSSTPEVPSWGKVLVSWKTPELPSPAQHQGTVHAQAAPTPDLYFAGVSRCLARAECLPACMETKPYTPAPHPSTLCPPLSAVLPFCSLNVPF